MYLKILRVQWFDTNVDNDDTLTTAITESPIRWVHEVTFVLYFSEYLMSK